MKEKYQFVWWKRWVGFRIMPPYPFKGKSKGKVYRWRICLGFFEIRRWGEKK